eukprot:7786605-Pyramimonas_sp.AAC.1
MEQTNAPDELVPVSSSSVALLNLGKSTENHQRMSRCSKRPTVPSSPLLVIFQLREPENLTGRRGMTHYRWEKYRFSKRTFKLGTGGKPSTRLPPGTS